MQSIAAEDVATALAAVAAGTPVNRIVELAGPEPLQLDELVRRLLSATDDSRPVIADTRARYFGAELNDYPSPGRAIISCGRRYSVPASPTARSSEIGTWFITATGGE